LSRGEIARKRGKTGEETGRKTTLSVGKETCPFFIGGSHWAWSAQGILERQGEKSAKALQTM